jgi:hypothetical protein
LDPRAQESFHWLGEHRMRTAKKRQHLQVEAMESKVMLSALMMAPAPRVAAAPAADMERAVATPLAVSRDSVRIQNKNGYAIDVTARLMVPGSIKPTITRRIGPNGATDTFSFGRHTNDFIWIEVKRAGGTTPPPFTVPLNQPLGGYFGKLFTVSEFGGRFIVSG